jgi:DUF4097 and DUF4098 domain-containing protein YvlB
MKRFLITILFSLGTFANVFPHAVTDGSTGEAKTFTVTPGGTLEMSLNSGDIRIVTWDKNEVSVRISDYDDDDGNIKMTQQGNTIHITDRDSWGEGGRFDISIPARFSLDLQTSNGDISVRGKLIGNINGQTSAGNIRFDDVDGFIDAHTSGGDVKTGKLTGKATLATSGGEIEVASSTSELELRSSGGDLRVGNVGKSLHAKTAGGDIIIGDVGGEAVVSTAGGNVRVGKVTGEASLSTAGGDVELKGGNGKIRAATSGGNVTLTNLSGSVDAKTSGGDIYAELVPSGKGKSRLATAAGTINLRVPENTKATIYARIRIRGSWDSQRDDYSIRSDFKAESSSRDRDDQEINAKYVLNGGGEEITLDTVNSDIEIRKLNK